MGIQILMSIWLSVTWNGTSQTEAGDIQGTILSGILLAILSVQISK